MVHQQKQGNCMPLVEDIGQPYSFAPLYPRTPRRYRNCFFKLLLYT